MTPPQLANRLSATTRQLVGAAAIAVTIPVGALAAQAGALAKNPKVVGLVYVAAFGPDVGEVVGGIGKAHPPTPILDKQGFLSLSTDDFVKA